MEAENAASLENNRLEKFFEGADLLIYDAQYLQKEYESSRVGWGHSAIEYAIETAQRAQVKRLALFHHDPERTDAQFDTLASTYCKCDREEEIQIFFAREGMRVEI
jgi:ribonuclease BN (tRNA processing enzyme)